MRPCANFRSKKLAGDTVAEVERLLTILPIAEIARKSGAYTDR